MVPWILFGVVLAVVAGSVLLIVTGHTTRELPSDSPEGVVQRFVQAALQRDMTRARSYVDPSTYCDVVDPGPEGSARVVLVGSSTDGDRAVVTLNISDVKGFGLVGIDRTDSTERAELTRVGTAWRLVLVPWPFGQCNQKVPDR